MSAPDEYLRPTAIYFCLALLVSVCYASLLLVLRCRRETNYLDRRATSCICRLLRLDRLGDGIFAVHEMRPGCRHILSTLMISLVVLPSLYMAHAFLFGFILSLIEDVEVADAVAYLHYGMSMLTSPVAVVTPASWGADMFCVVVAFYAFLLKSTVLGLAATMQMNRDINDLMPRFPLVRMLFWSVGVLLILCVLSVLAAGCLARFEDWGAEESLRCSFDHVTTGGRLALCKTPAPQSSAGCFTLLFATILATVVSGLWIGTLRCNQAFESFMAFMEGGRPKTVITRKEDLPPRSLDDAVQAAESGRKISTVVIEDPEAKERERALREQLETMEQRADGVEEQLRRSELRSKKAQEHMEEMQRRMLETEELNKSLTSWSAQVEEELKEVKNARPERPSFEEQVQMQEEIKSKMMRVIRGAELATQPEAPRVKAREAPKPDMHAMRRRGDEDQQTRAAMQEQVKSLAEWLRDAEARVVREKERAADAEAQADDAKRRASAAERQADEARAQAKAAAQGRAADAKAMQQRRCF